MWILDSGVSFHYCRSVEGSSEVREMDKSIKIRYGDSMNATEFGNGDSMNATELGNSDSINATEFGNSDSMNATKFGNSDSMHATKFENSDSMHATKIGNGDSMNAAKIGNLKFGVTQFDGEKFTVTSNDGKRVPNFCVNLFSLEKALKKGFKLSNDDVIVILNYKHVKSIFDSVINTMDGSVTGVLMNQIIKNKINGFANASIRIE
jgi:hypothetical protein